MIIDKEWRDKVFELLPWAQFITQDEDGDVLAWAEQPDRCNSSDWYSSGHESYLGTYLVEGEWEEMIFEREKMYLADGYEIREGFRGGGWHFYMGEEWYATLCPRMGFTKSQAIEAFNRMVGS